MRNIVLGISGAMLATASYGQVSTPKAAAETSVEEVVVTAQRRTERRQDVPIAVSVLSGAGLARDHVGSLQDLTARAPGLVATQSAGYGGAPLSIRGIGGANGGGNFFADEPVAIYVDGVYVARLSVATSDLVDVKAIEVVRGPQGTLFGRNSTAGALLVTTARPTRDLEGYVEAGIDTLGGDRLQGMISGPLIEDKVLGRVVLAHTRQGPFGENQVTGRKTNGGHSLTARASLRLLPIERLTVDLIGEVAKQTSQPGLFRIAQVTGGPTDNPAVRRADFNNALDHGLYAFNEANFNRIANRSLTAAAQWDGDAVVLNTVVGYRSFDVDGLADSDNTAPMDLTGGPLRSYSQARLRNRQTSGEFRLSSPPGRRLAWTVGVFGIHENNAVDPFEISTSTGYFGLGTDTTFKAFQTANAGAVFADASYSLTSRLTVRLGVRESSETKDFTDTQRVVTLAGGFSPPLGKLVPAGFFVAAPPTFIDAARFSNTSVRAVVDYRLAPDALAYVSYNQGFKSGGFNAFGLAPAFKPEGIDAFEGGIKSQLLDRRLQLNVAAFQYNYQNLQVRLPVPTGGVSIQNAAAARVRGAEAEASFAPAPGVSLGLAVTYLDAVFTEGQLPAVSPTGLFRFGASIPLQSVSIVGARMSRAPRWQVAGAADYERPLTEALVGSIGASYRFQTTQYYQETNQNSGAFVSGPWTEVGAHISLRAVDRGWSVSANADNIFDVRRITQITALSAFPYGVLNSPRRVSVRLVRSF
jgi:iron complex outermembrane receptor protein